jgi:zinc protease
MNKQSNKSTMNQIMKSILFGLTLVFSGLVIGQDALKVEKFVLDNGLTVILNEDPYATDAFGAVIIKAGSKNDPADATGMAHYLEHLLFKGTNELGAMNWEKEKPLMDSIIFYYDLLGKTTDEAERKKIQQLINNQSVQQSMYANPTEFDKLIKSIGGTQMNAFTATDMTVYHNAFPGDQMENWLELYAHRFQNPVFRSFQSELEVVYEEKNRGMDSPFNKLFEDIHKELFRTHPYGTQSTIGTTEHLKNPSLTKMYEYFNTYYVANNMALVISGNFDKAAAIPMIKEKFSKLRSAEVPEFKDYGRSQFNGKEIIEVKYTPLKIALLGYKTFPAGDKDEIAFDICTRLLYNESETGLVNKLQLDGKILFAGNVPLSYNDDGAYNLFFAPKVVGQSFEEAETLIYEAIQKVKDGNFSDEDLLIIKQEISRQRKEELERSEDKTMTLVQLFSAGSSWEEYLAEMEEIENITKEDIQKVANKYFTENHLVFRSAMGFPKKDVLEKPGFKPVVNDQKEDSEYAKKLLANIKAPENPRILDYNKDAELINIDESNKLYVTKNPINDLFTLKIERGVGTDSIKNLDIASDLFNYFYTKDKSRDELKQAFAVLGITYYTYANGSRFTTVLNGVEKNLEAALPLIKNLMYDPVVDQKALESVIENIIAGRESELKDPETLGRYLLEYARYGDQSEHLTRLPKKEVKALKVEDIVSAYKQVLNYDVTFYYIGTKSSNDVKAILTSAFPLKNTKHVVALKDRAANEIKKDIIYIIDDKKAVQNRVFFLINTPPFSGEVKDKVGAEAFNQYMSDGFSGILMQEIREYRSLAYTTSGAFITPIHKNNPGVFYSYVGCQSDKTMDAVTIMDSILRNMPQKTERINLIKSGLINSISSSFPNFRNVSSSIDRGRQRGYTESPLKKQFELYKTLTFEEINEFYETNIQNKPRIITIYGNAESIDKKELAKYGKIITLKIDDIIVE